MEQIEFKYTKQSDRQKGKAQGPGRCVNPATWVKGPCAITREKYYAFLRHRSQAVFRQEEYLLTFDDWVDLWTDELFAQRGKQRESMVMMRKNPTEGWTLDNVCIVPRITQLRRGKEYRAQNL